MHNEVTVQEGDKLVTVSILKDTLTQAFTDFGRDMRDFVQQEISASETRIKRDILDGVGDLLDNGISPQLDDHEKRIFKLEASQKLR